MFLQIDRGSQQANDVPDGMVPKSLQHLSSLSEESDEEEYDEEEGNDVA